ncbi:MAG: iron-sulfur cluster assembly scaffold protein [Clostridia bacterium]|nr:iron-sulfur cluster assembly scaffold protein [Clostridia bacterium]
MYSKKILERFSNLSYAGGLRGGDGTGKAENGNEVVKVYISVDERGEIDTIKFKAFGGVCTIVACDIACELVEGRTLSQALALTAQEILDVIELPENKHASAHLAQEAVKLAVEDYFEKKEKEMKKKQ